MIVVPVSGGKDSQCCLQLACRTGEKVVGLFCDTQYEHPLTYAHIEWMRAHYGVEIHSVTGGSVEEKIYKYKRFPTFMSRFCTDELKFRVTREWLRGLNAPCEIWYGMRSDESRQRAKRYKAVVATETYFMHEIFPSKYPKWLAKQGVRVRLPILNWSAKQVLEELGGCENPLYKAGFSRVGCFPCLAAGPKEIGAAFEFDEVGEERKHRIIKIEQDIGKVLLSNDGKPECLLCRM